jgi:hypothetical protein
VFGAGKPLERVLAWEGGGVNLPRSNSAMAAQEGFARRPGVVELEIYVRESRWRWGGLPGKRACRHHAVEESGNTPARPNSRSCDLLSGRENQNQSTRACVATGPKIAVEAWNVRRQGSWRKR